MRQIEWIGHRSVFSDPRVEFKMITGQYNESELRLLRIAALRRNVRINKVSVRELRPGSPDGLSRYYRFGSAEASYVQPVTDNDARVILNHPKLKHEFLDVTSDVPRGPNKHDLVIPESGVEAFVRPGELGRL